MQELKQRDVIVKQIKLLIQQLQQHHLIQNLVPNSHQDNIAEFMILNRLKYIDTYIQLCELTEKCLGQAKSDNKVNDRILNDQFHIQLIQFGMIENQKQKENISQK
ncbi:unnamed protein product [Paramecium sonneborni]|uniref:Uncharacterized protein n=1 Tax=Paramecium sonneborni TaxID=65129 RepID=A0A8S1RTP0_9CILI|nr:unnamed protein product [Paramecium sonneborni]